MKESNDKSGFHTGEIMITNLLKPASKLVEQNLKTILDKEEDYALFLYSIEESVVHEYLKNNKLKDKSLIGYLKSFAKNIDKKRDFFESEFETYLYDNITKALFEKKITMHELKLCINYILWSIDNRSWMGDSQGYVKWLAHSVGAMSESERIIYATKIRNLCKRKGIPESHVKAILSNNFDDVESVDKRSTDLESEFFALEEEEKINFIIKNYEDSPFLMDFYFSELMNEKNFEEAEELCNKMLDNIPDFPPTMMCLGIAYLAQGKNLLAKHTFESILKIIDSIPLDEVRPETVNRMRSEIEKYLKNI